MTGQTGKNGSKNVEIMVRLRYSSGFWRTLQMSLINCEVDLDLNWSKNCVKVPTNVADQVTTFSITDRKPYVSVVTLSTQDSTKLLEQLKSDFNRTINWNKYQSNKSIKIPNQYLDYLINPSK